MAEFPLRGRRLDRDAHAAVEALIEEKLAGFTPGDGGGGGSALPGEVHTRVTTAGQHDEIEITAAPVQTWFCLGDGGFDLALPGYMDRPEAITSETDVDLTHDGASFKVIIYNGSNAGLCSIVGGASPHGGTMTVNALSGVAGGGVGTGTEAGHASVYEIFPNGFDGYWMFITRLGE